MKLNKTTVWIVAGALGAVAVILLVVRVRQWRPRTITIQGAVIRRSADARKEVPIAGAMVTVLDDEILATTISTDSGYFKLTFREHVWPVEEIQLNFADPGYKPLRMNLQISLRNDLRGLYIAKMEPLAVPSSAASGRLPIVVSNVRIRYTVNYRTETNVGTAVKSFQVVNKGNVPCKREDSCSPNGLWKASTASITLDAGAGNILRNARAWCIAGPCPFTQIVSSGFEQGGQTVTASASDWSDTATFLVEAEVFHGNIASSVRESYPVIYGRYLHFTLPPTAEGPSIEATIGGTSMVFPLGTGLYMSWSTCNSSTGPQSERYPAYQCELKPGYRF